MGRDSEKKLVVVRGGGDLASGTIHRLIQCGFRVLVTEVPEPSSIRRYVSFSEAIYEGTAVIENVTAVRVSDTEEAFSVMEQGKVAVLVDPYCQILQKIRPDVLVDAIIAKKNMGTTIDMAPVTIALGPGFEAGVDVQAVIETKRGHNLGRIYYQGCAAPNTGIPGNIGGYTSERVIHAEQEGILTGVRKIGDLVTEGETIAWICKEEEKWEVRASISGVLRGLIRDGYPVTRGFKIADIDPRLSEKENCRTISDKARCIAGGVLEAILHISSL